jgi:hypothetical protein
MPAGTERRTGLRMAESLRLAPFLQAFLYFFLGVLLWAVVDFGTAGGFRIAYFETYGAALLVLYIGYPFVFTVLAFAVKAGERALFFATLLAILLIEVLFTGNPLLTRFPACLIGIPLSAAVYSPLTFFPLWIVRGEMRKHARIAVVLFAVECIVMFLSAAGSS